MALEFPSSPVDGQIYGNYQWNDTDGVWELLPVVTTAEEGGYARTFLLMGS